MAIGYQVTQNTINARAGALAIRLNQLYFDSNELGADVAAIGNAGLVTLGFSGGDATAMITATSLMSNLAGVYSGVPQGLLNFDAALAGLRGLNT